MYQVINVELVATITGKGVDREGCKEAVRLAVTENRPVRLCAPGLKDRLINPERFYDTVAMDACPEGFQG